jgi:hypothetical protein
VNHSAEKSGPNVRALVAELRAEVEERRASGRLSPEDVERQYLDRLRGYIDAAQIDPKLGARLLAPSFDWNIDPQYAPRSPRPGIEGALVRAAKTLVRPLVRLYTDHVLNRQAQINLVVWQFLLDSVQRTAALEAKVQDLERRLGERERA